MTGENQLFAGHKSGQVVVLAGMHAKYKLNRTGTNFTFWAPSRKEKANWPLSTE